MKKNRLLRIATILAMGLCLPACQDDPKPDVLGHINFYGEVYDLEQGALYHDNNYTVISVKEYTFEDRHSAGTDKVQGFTADVQEKETGNFMLGLYEHGFVLSDLTQDARGKGACICLRMASPEAEELAPGTYTFSLNKDAFTFRGVSSVNYSPEDGTTPNEFVDGRVDVALNGEVYTIDFKCVTSAGGSIEGTFTGKLKRFDVRKKEETVFSYPNLSLMALLPQVDYVNAQGQQVSEPDFQRGAAFLNSSTRTTYTAKLYKDLSEANKEKIDVALAYDSAAQAVRFESPIKMRALLWHNTFADPALGSYSFDLPCHTRYMDAPQDFTNERFENLQLDDFNFRFVEGNVSIPVGTKSPRFVFVQTGHGGRAILRIREVSPLGSQMVGGVTLPVNPAVVMDMKCPKSFSEPRMR